MKFRVSITLCFSAALITAVIVTRICQPYRAALQRSRLGQLIEQLSPSVPSECQIATRSELRQFGSNAIPFLISNIQCELRTPWAVYQRHKLELKQRFGRASSDDVIAVVKPRTDRQSGIIAAFEALGAAARPAIPMLTNLLNNPDTSLVVASALASIDPECLVYLTNAVRHKDVKIRAHAALALAKLKTNGFPAFPVLLTCLSDNDKSVRVNAVWALEEIAKTKPAVALPFLDDALHDTNTVARLLILRILGGLGERARPAVPTILVSAKENVSAVRDAAVKALKQIQPEALKELDGM